jgi:hypothetical protein
MVLVFRKDEYLNHLKTIKTCLYLFLCSNQVKYFAMEAPALASPKIARHVHLLLVHFGVSSNQVLKYSNKATSFIPNLLYRLKNVTHTASSPSSSSTSISSHSSTIVPRLRFCPAPPHCCHCRHHCQHRNYCCCCHLQGHCCYHCRCTHH